MPRSRKPDGLLSDTRVAASVVDLCGMDVLNRLPGRWVFYERDFTELFGDWQNWRGMKVSNLGFTYGLKAPTPKQRFLDFPDTCGTSDT